ncbi:MAG: hypothetical protein CEN91_431 [Candidatus Berkelbacteria bacterium Licking1014_85]|uniref:BrnT family toxin n=1 Tax=Candidatus Berkelbacteria bacterium Licking1014_85 TaxID=2017148 RepID=A0A554LI00_9BACT|nr:MAG: hypothetical protein CEN91_431 [Candidatus Berkelbacteria bacterium Licking1014_85]
MKIFNQPIGFEWDKGNIEKNFAKHKVTNQEAEEIFFDNKKKIAQKPIKINNENRFIAIGKTKLDRVLIIVFTLRNNKIRIISARDAHKKERNLYV